MAQREQEDAQPKQSAIVKSLELIGSAWQLIAQSRALIAATKNLIAQTRAKTQHPTEDEDSQYQ